MPKRGMNYCFRQEAAAEGGTKHMLYIYDNARGNVILAKPVPEKGFEEISRFQITEGANEHWCHPVIADKVLYIRRGDTLMAFDLKR